MRYLHSGGCGDVIYSLPYLRSLGDNEVTLLIKSTNNYNNVTNNYETLRPLLEEQPYIKSVEWYPPLWVEQYDLSIPFDVDLDKFRRVAGYYPHLIQTFFMAFEKPIPGNWTAPWLYLNPSDEWTATIENLSKDGPYAVINRTQRYRHPEAPKEWLKIMLALVQRKIKLYFIGLQVELDDFQSEFGKFVEVTYIPTNDLLECARIMAGSELFLCNQSVCLTLAQGMGLKYALEVAPLHGNCNMGTKREILLSTG